MSPKLKIRSIDVPLVLLPEGVVRVRGTRVPLDAVVEAYRQGETPEEIHTNYPTLQLRDIYAILAYYLRWQEEIDKYLRERDTEEEQLRAEIQARWPQDGLRERLLARREQQGANGQVDPSGG